MEKEQLFRTAGEWIEGNKDAIAGLNDLIWDYGEPGFCETKSAAALCELLSENGFAVKTGIANMPTTFVATFGTSRPRIGVMCLAGHGRQLIEELPPKILADTIG